MPSQFPIEEYLRARQIKDQPQQSPLVGLATAFTGGLGQGMVKRQEANVTEEQNRQKMKSGIFENYFKNGSFKRIKDDSAATPEEINVALDNILGGKNIQNSGLKFEPAITGTQPKVYHYVGKDKKTYIEKDGQIVQGTPQAGSIPRTLPEESIFGGLQSKRINLGMVKDFNTYAPVKKANDAINNLDILQDFINSGNPIANNAVATLAARGIGQEVGALSESDKKPFGGSQAIMARINQAFEQIKSGKLTDENRQYLDSIVKLTRKRTLENKQRSALEFSKQYSAATGDNAQTIYNMLLPSINSSSQMTIDNTMQAFDDSTANLKQGDSFMGGTFVGWED